MAAPIPETPSVFIVPVSHLRCIDGWSIERQREERNERERKREKERVNKN
jgi:hypothetical protein